MVEMMAITANHTGATMKVLAVVLIVDKFEVVIDVQFYLWSLTLSKGLPVLGELFGKPVHHLFGENLT